MTRCFIVTALLGLLVLAGSPRLAAQVPEFWDEATKLKDDKQNVR